MLRSMAINIGLAPVPVNVSGGRRALLNFRLSRQSGKQHPTMSKPHIPAPREQVVPSAENLFKAILLLALLFGSFALTQQGVNALATSTLPSGP